MNIMGVAADTLLCAGIIAVFLPLSGGALVWPIFAVLGAYGVLIAVLPTFVRARRPQVFALVILSGLVVLVFKFQMNSVAWICTLVGLSFLALRSMIRIRERTDHERQHIRLYVDLIPMAISLLSGLARPEIDGTAIALFAAAAVSRLVAMRRGAVHLAREMGLAQPLPLRLPLIVLTIALALAGAAMYWFPAFRNIVLLVLLIAFLVLGFILLPYKWSSLATLVLVMLLMWLVVTLLHRNHPEPHAHHGGIPGRIKFKSVAHPLMFNLHTLEQIALYAGAAILLAVLIKQGLSLWEGGKRDAIDTEVTIVHRSLKDPRSRAARQATLLSQLLVRSTSVAAATERPLLPGDSARVFLSWINTWLNQHAPTQTDAAQALVEAYEAERYGGIACPAERVEEIRAELRRSGLLAAKLRPARGDRKKSAGAPSKPRK
ncbi:MAG: DUF4129 domain-containing protein [Bacilli bacterium]